MLKTLVAYRLIDPGSEWRLHRQWYDRSAMGDLLGEDFDLVPRTNVSRCLDKLLAHKTDLFSFLQQRWKTLFEANRSPALRLDQRLLKSSRYSKNTATTGGRRCCRGSPARRCVAA